MKVTAETPLCACGGVSAVLVKEVLMDVEISQLVSEGNVRWELGDLSALENSLDRLGMLQPVVVQKHDDGFVIVDGHRRVAAAEALGWSYVPAYEVTDYDVDTATRIEAQLAANIFREDLTLPERAQAMLDLKETGMNQAEIAKAVGLSQKQVSRYQKLGRSEVPDVGEIAEDELWSLVDEVPEPDIAETVERFLSPHADDYRFRDLEEAYRRVQRDREIREHWEAIQAVAVELETEGIEIADAKPGNATFIHDVNEQEWGDWELSNRFIIDVEKHRKLDCHVYWFNKDWQENVTGLSEGCTKPQSHLKDDAELQRAGFDNIREVQSQAKDSRREEKERKQADRHAAKDWFNENTFSKAEQFVVAYEFARRVLPHGWQKDLCQILELEVGKRWSDYEQKDVPDWESCIEQELAKLSETKQREWMLRALVIINFVGNRRYAHRADGFMFDVIEKYR